MHLKTLSLLNYKNIESKKLDFDPRINCFVGNNGVGKTNILDAIYHLSFGKSYFNPITSQNIKHDCDFFMLEGLYERNDRDEKVAISAKRSAKKKLSKNGKELEKVSEHIGFLPLVIISPADNDLISEGSVVRRKFIDGVLSQTNPEYLQKLLHYNKTLSQRNALLKYFAANHTFDKDNLDIYNEQLVSFGEYLHLKRKEFVSIFSPLLIKRYNYLSQSQEAIDLSYNSKLHDCSFATLLKDQLAKDRILQHTSVGVHKDDLLFSIDNYPIKKFGSQGQQKSFLIALKLAQFDFLLHTNQTAPIILLDDIFDKLDEHRVTQLIQLVDDAAFGQIFVSDTNQDRTEKVVKTISQSYKIFNLNHHDE